MIRVRVPTSVAVAVAVVVGTLMLLGYLPGGPGGTSPTVPSVAPPTRPTVPERADAATQQEFPDGVTAFTGDVTGEPRRVFVDVNSNAREGDVQVIYDGVNETDQGLQARMRVSSTGQPGGPVNLYPGDRFEFSGYVFRVGEDTNAWRLALDVWTLT